MARAWLLTKGSLPDPSITGGEDLHPSPRRRHCQACDRAARGLPRAAFSCSNRCLEPLEPGRGELGLPNRKNGFPERQRPSNRCHKVTLYVASRRAGPLNEGMAGGQAAFPDRPRFRTGWAGRRLERFRGETSGEVSCAASRCHCRDRRDRARGPVRGGMHRGIEIGIARIGEPGSSRSGRNCAGPMATVAPGRGPNGSAPKGRRVAGRCSRCWTARTRNASPMFSPAGRNRARRRMTSARRRRR